MKTIRFILVSLICMLVIAPQYGAAQEASSEAHEEEAAERIREEITRIVQEENPATKKGYAGEITDIFNQTVVLQTSSGKLTAKITGETTIVGQNQKSIAFEDLEIGQFVLVMGYQQESELLSVRRVVVSKKPSETEREALMGEIIEVEDEKLIIKLVGTNEPAFVLYDKTTLVTDTDGESELMTGQVIVAAGSVISELKIQAGCIRIISTPKPTPTAGNEETGSAR